MDQQFIDFGQLGVEIIARRDAYDLIRLRAVCDYLAGEAQLALEADTNFDVQEILAEVHRLKYAA